MTTPIITTLLYLSFAIAEVESNHNGTEQGYIIEISRDEALIQKMLERAKETIEIRDRIVNEYLSKLK
jgi:hypothetical protein